MIHIRRATGKDVPVLYAMLRASAIEQGGLGSLCATEENLLEDGFGPTPKFQVLLAERNGDPVGLALYFFVYSTWTSRNGLYLEDLYVTPEHRRYGVAREMMQHLTQAARDNGCGRMIWLVLRTNPAVEFYKRMDASALEDWMPMQMKTPEITLLADGSAKVRNCESAKLGSNPNELSSRSRTPGEGPACS